MYNEGKNDEEIYNIIKDINPFNIRKGEIVEITSGRRFSSITNLKQINIPSLIDNIPAIKVESGAINDCHSLKYVIISDNVSTIG